MEEEPHFILAYHYAGAAKSSKDITAKAESNHLQIERNRQKCIVNIDVLHTVSIALL
jgi:hypothetical protein